MRDACLLACLCLATDWHSCDRTPAVPLLTLPPPAPTPRAAGGGLLGLFLVQSGLIALRSALLNISGERIAARLRNGLFKAVMSQVRVVVTIMIGSFRAA